MTGEQIRDLERILDDSVCLILWKDTVRDVSVLLPQIEQADAIAAVLPTELMARLMPLAGTRPVLQSVSGRQATGKTITLPDGRQEPEFSFSHLYWQQILRLDVLCRRLCPQDLAEGR